MAITNTFSTVEPKKIPVNGTALVTLGLTAIPGLLSKPTDIVIVLDSSARIEAQIMDEMRRGAKGLVETVNEALGGQLYDPLPDGYRMGLVIYQQGTAIVSIRLTNETIQMDAGIMDIRRGQGTANHAEAFRTATAMLSGSTGQKAIIFFSYGPSEEGGDAAAAAQAARDQGIQVFGLGPETRRSDLTAWSSRPSSYYVCINIGGQRMTVPFE